MKLRFDGNLALILGGSSDLGIALAKSMMESEITPVLAYRNDAGKQRIEKTLYPIPAVFKTVLLDFSVRDTLKNISHETTGVPDFLVDFAQSNYERLLSSADTGDVYNYFETNISYRAAVLNRISRMMLKRKKGRCVFVSSTGAARPNPGQGFYAAAKAASEALYRNLGLELGCRGISTVILRPGYIDAGRGRDYLKIRSEAAVSRIPIGRALSADEISETILFLLSESAGGFNATEICMDGGLNAGKT